MATVGFVELYLR